MGYATIVSGGTDGRYVISLDWGESTKAALLAAIGVLLARLEISIADAQARVDAAQVLEDAAAARYDDAVTDFIALHREQPPGSPRPDDSAVRFALARLRELQTAHEPRRINLAALKFEQAQALKRVAYWNTFQASETRSVWCVDFTEDAAASTVVATLDIPGESSLMVLAPGARAWTPSDGQMVARELMSPEQVFFNAAILPGWQIDAPTYRWGTVTAIDTVSATVDVTLADAESSAQRLDINRETALAAVPVDYMETGSSVFVEGDRVVVQFIGQSWASPRVLGFLDNPRPAGNWEAMAFLKDTALDVDILALRVRSGADPTFSEVMAAAASGALQGSYRLNRGSWVSFDRDATVPTAVLYTVAGHAVNTGWDMVLVTSTAASGLQVAISAIPDMGFSTGDIVEVRMYLSGDLILNAAFKTDPSSAAEVAIVGRLLNLDLPATGYEIPMTRLSYHLFQNAGT